MPGCPAPTRAGHYDGEYVYVDDLTDEQFDLAVSAERARQIELARLAAMERNQFLSNTKEKLNSTMHKWIGGQWRRQQGGSGGGHAERAAYNAIKSLKSGDWIGFTQNAWPCIRETDSCTEYFQAESLRTGVNFVFNIVGNSSGYAAAHNKPGDQRGSLVIQNGTTTYGAINAAHGLPPG